MSIRIETAFHDAASLYHQNSTGKQKINQPPKALTIVMTNHMKKQIKKLAFSTEKIMSLTKTQLQNAQGGGPSFRPGLNLYPDYTVAGSRCLGSITGE